MSVERELTKMEREIEAIKATFARVGVTMPVFTKTATIATTQNNIHYEYTINGRHVTHDGNAMERVAVTFATARGSNTIAALEYTLDNTLARASVERQRYNGGAKWLITMWPAYDDNSGLWRATNLEITVHSMVDGILTVENATS